jgi:ATP-dependent Clp protease protease subunit
LARMRGKMDAIKIPTGINSSRRRIFARAPAAAMTDAGADVVLIDDEIGPGMIDARYVAARLDAIGPHGATVRINSPGGSVFEGLSIYNLLTAYPARLTVEVTGIAASIASVIAMAGQYLRIYENSFLMIHSAWSFVIGNASDMAAESDVLRKIDESLVGIYSSRTGIASGKISKMMAAETWLSKRAFRSNKETKEIFSRSPAISSTAAVKSSVSRYCS